MKMDGPEGAHLHDLNHPAARCAVDWYADGLGVHSAACSLPVVVFALVLDRLLQRREAEALFFRDGYEGDGVWQLRRGWPRGARETREAEGWVGMADDSWLW